LASLIVNRVLARSGGRENRLAGPDVVDADSDCQFREVPDLVGTRAPARLELI
jgi:hypothetical protein